MAGIPILKASPFIVKRNSFAIFIVPNYWRSVLNNINFKAEMLQDLISSAKAIFVDSLMLCTLGITCLISTTEYHFYLLAPQLEVCSMGNIIIKFCQKIMDGILYAVATTKSTINLLILAYRLVIYIYVAVWIVATCLSQLSGELPP
jgi:hypothetical protein